MGIENITDIAEVSIESGKSSEVSYDQDSETRFHDPTTVAGDIGMYFDGHGDIPDGRRVFALTDPTCLNPEARYSIFHPIYQINKHEILDARMDPPEKTVGYDIEITDENGAKRALIVTLTDKLAEFKAAAEKPKEDDIPIYVTSPEETLQPYTTP
jgi:hypothetical protein